MLINKSKLDLTKIDTNDASKLLVVIIRKTFNVESSVLFKTNESSVKRSRD